MAPTGCSKAHVAGLLSSLCSSLLGNASFVVKLTISLSFTRSRFILVGAEQGNAVFVHGPRQEHRRQQSHAGRHLQATERHGHEIVPQSRHLPGGRLWSVDFPAALHRLSGQPRDEMAMRLVGCVLMYNDNEPNALPYATLVLFVIIYSVLSVENLVACAKHNESILLRHLCEPLRFDSVVGRKGFGKAFVADRSVNKSFS